MGLHYSIDKFFLPNCWQQVDMDSLPDLLDGEFVSNEIDYSPAVEHPW